MERVNFHLSESEINNLEKLSETMGIKKAEIIRRAIDDYIQRKKWEGVTGLEVCA